jgi:hypothetical protein
VKNWGGPPLGVQIPYTFPTPKMGIKHIEQFSDIILRIFFFRPTPDGSRQVVYQAGKTIALCKFTELMQ